MYRKYKRNFRKRPIKRSKGRARFMRVGQSVGSAAYSALKIARKLKDAVNIEYKYYSQNNAISADYGGTVTALNLIPQGITDSQRIGDSLKMQNLTIRGVWTLQGGQQAVCRHLVVLDHQNKVSTAGDVLDNIGSGYAPYSAKQYDKRFQTRILYDKTFVVDANNPLKAFDLVVPVNSHTQYDSALTTIDTGALKIICLSNIAAGATAPYFSFTSRLTYTDNQFQAQPPIGLARA